MKDEHTHHISEEDYDPYSAAEGSGRLWNRNYILAMTANFLLAFSLYCLMPILPIYLSEEYHAGRDGQFYHYGTDDSSVQRISGR